MFLFQIPIYSIIKVLDSRVRFQYGRWVLVMLSLLIGLSIVILLRKEIKIITGSNLGFLTNLTILFCIGVFLSVTILEFFIYFELSLIPIFWLILGRGNQPERIKAGFRLFFYTLTASLPLLFILIINWGNFTKFNFLEIYSVLNLLNRGIKELYLIFFTLAFLTKLPIFILHLWLPLAHVEAPVGGSILLAALLLKLGGYGLFILSPLFHKVSYWSIIIYNFSLLGGAYMGLLCFTQKDIKVLIAYSSVRHISFVVAASQVRSVWAFKGALLIIVAHGFSSSGLFAAAYLPYARIHSRNILILKSILTLLPVYSILWFLLCLANIGAPPTVNLVSEIILLISLINLNMITFLRIGFITFFSAVYSLILYLNTSQGQISWYSNKIVQLYFYELRTMVVHLPYLLVGIWVTIYFLF